MCFSLKNTYNIKTVNFMSNVVGGWFLCYTVNITKKLNRSFFPDCSTGEFAMQTPKKELLRSKSRDAKPNHRTALIYFICFQEDI